MGFTPCCSTGDVIWEASTAGKAQTSDGQCISEAKLERTGSGMAKKQRSNDLQIRKKHTHCKLFSLEALVAG